MKYLVLIYSNPARWEHPVFLHHATVSDEERDTMLEQFTGLMDELSETGELVDSRPLAAPESTRTIRVRDGSPVITDGPFSETKEQLAGYFLVDCDSAERAEAIAARFPDASFGAVEVRRIME